jgi:hypothetical protein
LRDRGVARGTFKVHHFGIQFFYRHTLDRDWPLFSKKEGLRGIEWAILRDHSGGSMQVRTLRRRYSSSRSP